MITTHLWIVWLKIAKERAQAARSARDEAVAMKAREQSYVRPFAREFEAAVAAVDAAANSLVALHGSLVIPDSVRQSIAERSKNQKKKMSSEAKIREALGTQFVTGKQQALWASDFSWLFKLRNFAAHAQEEAKPPVPHPIGDLASPVQVDYTAEAAERALAVVIQVLDWCSKNPRANLPDAKKWALELGNVLKSLDGNLP